MNDSINQDHLFFIKEVGEIPQYSIGIYNCEICTHNRTRTTSTHGIGRRY